MSIPRSYKLPFEHYCIHQEKYNKCKIKLYFICNDCGHCYTNFFDMLEMAIIEQKYDKEYNDIYNYIRKEFYSQT